MSFWNSLTSAFTTPLQSSNTNQESGIVSQEKTGNSLLDALGSIGGAVGSYYMYEKYSDNELERRIKEQELNQSITNQTASSTPVNLSDKITQSLSFKNIAIISIGVVGLLILTSKARKFI